MDLKNEKEDPLNDQGTIGEVDLKHGKDDLQEDFSATEKRDLASMCAMKLLTAGEKKVGKSSLVLSMMAGKSNCTEEKDRTKVLECRSWRFSEEKVIPIYDLGGHSAYTFTAHLFFSNAAYNAILLCHPFFSDDYQGTFRWLQTIVVNAPKATVIPVLTQGENVDKHEECKKRYISEMNTLIDDELDNIEKSKSKGVDEKVLITVEAFYEKFRRQLDKRVFITSSITFEGVDELKMYIVELSESEEFNYQIPKGYVDLYVELGTMGVKNEKRNQSNQAIEEEDVVDVEVTNPNSTENSSPDSSLPSSLPDNVLIPSQNISDLAATALTQSRMDSDSASSRKDKETELDETQPAQCLTSRETLPEKLQLVTFQEALSRFKELQPEMQACSEEDLKTCLRKLSSYGLIIWHEGTEELENMVFNNIFTLVTAMKAIFNHNIKEELDFKKLDRKIRRLFDNEGDFEKEKHKFLKQGLISHKILQCLLFSTPLKDHTDGIIDLLEKFDMGHSVNTKSEKYIFVPFHNKRKQLPGHIIKRLRTLDKCSRTELALVGIIEGNISPIFWFKFCANLVKYFYLHCLFEAGDVFAHGFCGQKNCVKVLVEYDGKEEIKTTLKTNVKGESNSDNSSNIKDLWECLKQVNSSTEDMMKVFPGIIAAAYVLCAHCQTASYMCRGKLNEILEENASQRKMISCETKEEHELPSTLRYPLPEGDDQDIRLQKLQKYLEEHHSKHKGQKLEEIPVICDISDESLDNLSKHISSVWKELGRFLGLSAATLTNIESGKYLKKKGKGNATQDDTTSQPLQMLNLWKHGCEEDDKRRFLYEKLKCVGLQCTDVKTVINDVEPLEQKNEPESENKSCKVALEERPETSGMFGHFEAATPSPEQQIPQAVKSELVKHEGLIQQVLQGQQVVVQGQQVLSEQVFQQGKALAKHADVIKKEVLQGQQIVVQGQQVLSEQMFQQGKAQAQHADIIKKEVVSKVALDAGDAASIQLICRNRLLRKFQSQIEDHLVFSQEFYDRLISNDVIDLDKKTKLLSQQSKLGKTKQLLNLIDSNPESSTKVSNLVNALLECEAGSSNKALGELMLQELD